MKPEELRNNLKATLDKAVAGEAITIVRSGQTFELRAIFPVNKWGNRLDGKQHPVPKQEDK